MSTIRFTDGPAPGEFERPAGWFWDGLTSPTTPTILRLDEEQGVVAARVVGSRGRLGVGVWELADGRARWAHDWADNVVILPSEVLACTHGRLGRYRWPDMSLIEEVEAHQYTELLVVSASQQRVLAYLNDGQGANGYELFDLNGGLARLGIGELMTLDPMYAMPVFSPSERLVACSPGVGDTWWTPPEEEWPDDFTDEAAIPSRGGIATFAWLLVHDIEADVVNRHRLQYDLPAGWVPADIDDSRWAYGAIGLEWLTDDRLRVIEPDGLPVDLSLPLPPTVLLSTPDPVLPPSV